jgi:hypothetical protein
MTNEEKLTELERHAAELSELYDSVQIFATGLNSDGTTFSHKRGQGNWYARQGMAHEFIQENIAADTADKLAEKLDPPDDWKYDQIQQ